jgi:chromosome partitioning protein
MLKGVMFDREEWVKVFKKNLSEVEGDYDYIILDLPPSVSMITESAWVISDYLLVPISDYFALNGAE